ncbi:hypothetical protein B0H16DRAFT_1699948 [Mycena metata]|uniref:Uncharacterized protein n=1 Tax=Mycena metata TaxID=1033252 RepID=A0AAD7MJJ5_9AGAR|nr:hypothetical protein B0H16DRAFT_1699948 [Mycena metata]
MTVTVPESGHYYWFYPKGEPNSALSYDTDGLVKLVSFDKNSKRQQIAFGDAGYETIFRPGDSKFLNPMTILGTSRSMATTSCEFLFHSTSGMSLIRHDGAKKNTWKVDSTEAGTRVKPETVAINTGQTYWTYEKVWVSTLFRPGYRFFPPDAMHSESTRFKLFPTTPCFNSRPSIFRRFDQGQRSVYGTVERYRTLSFSSL